MLVFSARRWALSWRALALALLLLLSAPAQAAVLRKGPYLIYRGLPTAMTIRWPRPDASCSSDRVRRPVRSSVTMNAAAVMAASAHAPARAAC